MAHSAMPMRDLLGSRVKRFVIKSRLGSGGMAEVFLGEDLLLKRNVAIKVTRYESATQRKSRALLKEAERASQLNDEHIARIYDVVEQDGRLFIVLEHVEGETLRARLRKPLSVQEFFSIAEQCLSGLMVAHQQGILHCDLKPENLMITPSGLVKILDFGFARRMETPETVDSLSTVLPGGTPAYMAPEVVFGASADERADIFALGVVFYEALAGQRPFGKRPALSLAEARVEPDPIPRAMPEGLKRVIARMIALDPTARYRSCADALADLRAVRENQQHGGKFTSPRLRVPQWTRVAPVMSLLLFALLLFSSGREHLPWRLQPASAATRQLVVLPFHPVNSSDADSQAFAQGLTDTLSAKLGELAVRYPLEVTAESEVRAQKVRDPQSARRMLGATMALEGSLQRSGNVIRVVYSLVDTNSLRLVYSGVVTADAASPFAVQDRVIQQVLSDLDIDLQKDDRGRMLSHGTTSPPAYDYYLRARGYLQEYDRLQSVQNAVSSFEASVQADPAFSLAFAGLGQAYMRMYVLAHGPDMVPRATAACQRAAQLDGSSPDAELCLGNLLNVVGKYEDAAHHLERALMLDSTREEGYRELSDSYESLHRFADAESLLRKNIAMHPRDSAACNWLGSFYTDRGRYADAIEQFNRMLELAPDSVSGYSNLGGVYLLQGDYSRASAALEKSIAIQPTAPALSNLGAAYFYDRKYAQAAANYARAAEMSPREYVAFGNLAEAYAQIEGKQEESRASYAQALKLAEERLAINPNNGAVRLNAALYAAMLGQAAKAESYRKSGLKRSTTPDARFSSALVLAQLHQDHRAMQELQLALRAGWSISDVTNNPAWQRFSVYPEYRAIVVASAVRTN